MSMEVEIRAKMVEALKSGNKQDKEVYSSILAALKNKSKDLMTELTPEQALEVIMKLAKQNQESIETCPADRAEIMSRLNHESSILRVYMPKQMDEAEIKDVIQGVLDNLGISAIEKKDKGKVMKELMPLVKGKADGKLVNKLIENYMK